MTRFYVYAESGDDMLLPDAEHVHVTITNGTITAVPMEHSEGWERFVAVDSADGSQSAGMRMRSDLWVDAPGETP